VKLNKIISQPDTFNELLDWARWAGSNRLPIDILDISPIVDFRSKRLDDPKPTVSINRHGISMNFTTTDNIYTFREEHFSLDSGGNMKFSWNDNRRVITFRIL